MQHLAIEASIITWIISVFLTTATASAAEPLKEVSMGIPYKFTRNQALVEYHNLLTHAFSDIGYKVVLTRVAIQSSHEMLVSGTVDMVPYDDLADAKGRDQIVTTSFPVVLTVGTVFHSKIRPIKEIDLAKYRGAISKNNTAIIRDAEKRKLKFIQTANPFHCIQTVVEKKTDYCITIHEVGKSTVSSSPEARGLIVPVEKPFVQIPVHVSMNKKYAADLPKLEAALKERLRGDLSKYPTLRGALNTNP
ncbi:hypothetical protein B9G69_002055 [Bdellovibrio sp. SKB1291214]|uniref:hypothetical protein n=1 Tax=Bdellovibrio sp. SKB1291214 TaxID=1732569 RepID=UPI000B751919|nr:hypothetical protein [Bdellovibrio sp. SKB1291214]UYL09354.1 hypothetical protein B9G69_002055 [Bdellovibrio sp. SKB1291214]